MSLPLKTSVLIIGAGPAGLAAALACSRHMVTTTIFSNGKFRNDLAKEMHVVPTWDGSKPAQYRAAARKELQERYKTNTFVDVAVKSLKQLPDGRFSAVTVDGTEYEGKKVVLATGSRDIFPDITGYEECWAQGIYQCLFCDGYEDRGTDHAGVLAIGLMSNPQFCIPNACMAHNLAKTVTIYTDGNDELAGKLRPGADKHGLKVDSRKIARLELQSPDRSDINVYFEDDNARTLKPDSCGFIAHKPYTEFIKPWHDDEDGLPLEYTELRDVKVHGMMNETSIHGVFVGGDASTFMKSFGGAAASGNLVGAAVVHQISMNE